MPLCKSLARIIISQENCFSLMSSSYLYPTQRMTAWNSCSNIFQMEKLLAVTATVLPANCVKLAPTSSLGIWLNNALPHALLFLQLVAKFERISEMQSNSVWSFIFFGKTLGREVLWGWCQCCCFIWLGYSYGKICGDPYPEGEIPDGLGRFSTPCLAQGGWGGRWSHRTKAISRPLTELPSHISRQHSKPSSCDNNKIRKQLKRGKLMEQILSLHICRGNV